MYVDMQSLENQMSPSEGVILNKGEFLYVFF